MLVDIVVRGDNIDAAMVSRPPVHSSECGSIGESASGRYDSASTT
jgi:hypothetical protein